MASCVSHGPFLLIPSLCFHVQLAGVSIPLKYFLTKTNISKKLWHFIFLIQTSRWRDCIPWRQENCISDLSAVLKKVYGVRTWDWEKEERREEGRDTRGPY